MIGNKRFDMDYEETYRDIIYLDNGEAMTNKEVLDRLNQFDEENEILKSTNMEYEDVLGRLEEENEKLKNDGLSYIFSHYLNKTLVKDIKTLLVVLAFCEFPKSNRLSTDEFGAIARLQGFICENIIDLDELKKEVGR